MVHRGEMSNIVQMVIKDNFDVRKRYNYGIWKME